MTCIYGGPTTTHGGPTTHDPRPTTYQPTTHDPRPTTYQPTTHDPRPTTYQPTTHDPRLTTYQPTTHPPTPIRQSLTETSCSEKVLDSFWFPHDTKCIVKIQLAKCGGGIVAYVNVSLDFKRREDFGEIDLECLWL